MQLRHFVNYTTKTVLKKNILVNNLRKLQQYIYCYNFKLTIINDPPSIFVSSFAIKFSTAQIFLAETRTFFRIQIPANFTLILTLQNS